MFDFLDAFVAAEPLGRGRATNGEQLAWALAFLGFPMLTFMLWVWFPPDGPELAERMIWGAPAVFTLLTILLCRRVGARFSWTLQSAFVCFLFCMGAGFAAAILSIF
jgi:hypothetical protein